MDRRRGAFSSVRQGSTLVVSLPVRVDVSVAREMLEVLEKAVADSQTNIVLDLSDTQSLDSTALGAIVTVLKKCRAEAGDLVLACVGEGVKRVLAITRLDRVMAVYDTRQKAVGRFLESEQP